MADSEITYEDRLFLAGQAVYEQIVNGTCGDVDAALWDARLSASDDN
jgi:hypothetical protein